MVTAAFEDGFVNGIMALMAEFNPWALMFEATDGLLSYTFDKFAGLGRMIDEALSGYSLYDTGKALLQTLWDGATGVVIQMVAALKAKIAGIVPDWMQSGFAWVSGGDGTPPGGGAAPIDPGTGLPPIDPGNTLPIDSRPALGPDQITSSATDNSTTNITINAAPGMNEQALAKETARAVDGTRRRARATSRKSQALYDQSEDAQ